MCVFHFLVFTLEHDKTRPLTQALDKTNFHSFLQETNEMYKTVNSEEQKCAVITLVGSTGRLVLFQNGCHSFVSSKDLENVICITVSFFLKKKKIRGLLRCLYNSFHTQWSCWGK